MDSNLADVFTDYKGVTKSLNLAVNAPCRVEVPTKITLPPKRRASQQKDAFNKRSKTVNTSQPKDDGHQMDTINS
jgi:hypothetical protein